MNRVTERRSRVTELRATGGNTIVGYAAVYNSLSHNLGGFKERIAPGCFAASLRTNPDVKCLLNHDPNLIVARAANGSLRLREDNVGLRMEADVADTTVGRDLLESVRSGLIDEMSFAFKPDSEDWDDEDDDETGERIAVRTLLAASLIDVSPVVYPAYPGTSLSSMSPVVTALGRGLSFDEMFPEGAPMEIRSRFPHIQQRNTSPLERRRRLFNFVAGL